MSDDTKKLTQMDGTAAGREIWVYGDIRSATLLQNSLNVLAGALKLSGLTGGTTVFVLVGDPTPDVPGSLFWQEAAEQALAFGAHRVLHLEVKSTGTAALVPEQESHALAAVLETRDPAVFLFPLNVCTREICARTAVLCNAGTIADCMDFKYENDEIIAVCPSQGGDILYQLGFTRPGATGFMTVQPHAFTRLESDAPAQEIDTLEVTVPECPHLIRRSCSLESGERRRLETARKVVVGGAGLGNVENFTHVRRLAAALGAEVGATRPPVLWHWIDEERLIGQTGKTVSPDLLISLGTSGAVQYTAGITGAGMVVAVNKDPDAPIFRFADVGIVADVNRFLPVFAEKIQQISMRSLADAMDNGAAAGRGGDFGSRLLRMRRSHGLTREVLAQSVGRTPEFIQEVENNQTTASVGLLIKLAEVFGIDAGTFLNDEEHSKLSGERARAYTRRTTNYHYQTLTPGAENEHLRVFMVTIESRQAHKPVAYRHEGEEFIYVMEGKLELSLDGRHHTLMPGESMKFNSEIPHQLKSLSDEGTRCLVTLYTP